MSEGRYDRRGVSASKSEIHEAIRSLDKGLYPEAFCKIIPDVVAGDPAFVNVMHADTAGTKPSLAYMYWKETGDMSVWKGIVQDAIVMNLDDMACVGCVNNIILSSTIGRNKHLIPGEVITALINAAVEFIEEMRKYGVIIHHSGGETADVGDIVRTLDVGFTAFARISKQDLIINQIQPGDVIVGFASFGQAAYETEYNGGMGSNGLSSARHDVFSPMYREKYPECYDPNTNPEYIFCGSKQLTDPVRAGDQDIPAGKLVLSPTRTYLPLITSLLKQFPRDIHGMIHNTGGGQTKVLKFIHDLRVIKDHLFDIPPLFQLIRDESGTEFREMYQVFNMGHRLEIYTGKERAQEMIDLSRSFGIDAQIIGHVEKHSSNELIIESPFGRFEYV